MISGVTVSCKLIAWNVGVHRAVLNDTVGEVCVHRNILFVREAKL